MPSDSSSPRPDLPSDAGVDAIQADIEQTRKELGETVNALSAKADVTGRVKEKVNETRRNVPVGPLAAALGAAVVVVLLLRRRRRRRR